MTQHKWHKEIKAWADGAEIEIKDKKGEWESYTNTVNFLYHDDIEYRIKPQPKEPQYSFKGMCEIPYKHWVLRFYQMPNDLWYSEGMDDAWMKEMVEASKPQPKEPQYLYAYKLMTNQGLKIQFWDSKVPYDEEKYIGKIKLEVDDYA